MKDKNIREADINPLSKSIIKTLAYYDIFNYPLTLNEIYFCLDTDSINTKDLNNEVNSLLGKNIIYTKNDYYLLNPDYNRVIRRVEGNGRANRKMKTAKWFANFISFFPFVRAVFLSGSISKGYLDKDADIDYFIITKQNRLWLARFILVVFKKIFLLNSYKYFCINYFISEDNLEIEEKNIYTATELVTLIPVYGANLYDNFYYSNAWIKSYCPNYPKRDTSNVPEGKLRFSQRVIEPILSTEPCDKLDDYVMNLFLKFDKKRYGTLDADTFSLAFKTRKNISKHHPNYFQKKVLTALHQKIKQLENQHNIVLN